MLTTSSVRAQNGCSLYQYTSKSKPSFLICALLCVSSEQGTKKSSRTFLSHLARICRSIVELVKEHSNLKSFLVKDASDKLKVELNFTVMEAM